MVARECQSSSNSCHIFSQFISLKRVVVSTLSTRQLFKEVVVWIMSTPQLFSIRWIGRRCDTNWKKTGTYGPPYARNVTPRDSTVVRSSQFYNLYAKYIGLVVSRTNAKWSGKKTSCSAVKQHKHTARGVADAARPDLSSIRAERRAFFPLHSASRRVNTRDYI